MTSRLLFWSILVPVSTLLSPEKNPNAEWTQYSWIVYAVILGLWLLGKLHGWAHRKELEREIHEAEQAADEAEREANMKGKHDGKE